MKSVILFRHGKSDWNASYGSDHDRPLNKRGIEAAKKMGQFLYSKHQVPDLVISSTAIRAKTTIELAMKSSNWSSELILEKGIYGGSPDYLLSLIHIQKEKHGSICLVGHEPNFSSLNLCVHILTVLNMAKISFDVNSWVNVQFSTGKLEWHQQPKNLEVSN